VNAVRTGHFSGRLWRGSYRAEESVLGPSGSGLVFRAKFPNQVTDEGVNAGSLTGLRTRVPAGCCRTHSHERVKTGASNGMLKTR